MNALRLLLAFWLCLAVPVAGFAAVASGPHCQQAASISSGVPAEAHVGHAMPGEAIEMDHASMGHGSMGHDTMGHSQMGHVVVDEPSAADTGAPSDHCNCGCDCTGHHCVSTSSSGPVTSANTGLDDSCCATCEVHYGTLQLSAAHPLDLLRPPSLT